MLLEQNKREKRPFYARGPFPWQCPQCAQTAVSPQTIDYEIDVNHDGRIHPIRVEGLRVPVCSACGEKLFTNEVDEQINAALRCHLGLLSPAQMREAIDRVGMSQKEIAARLGIAEASLSRWLNETQIQSRSMDNLLRVFFAFPQVREALSSKADLVSLGIGGERPARAAAVTS